MGLVNCIAAAAGAATAVGSAGGATAPPGSPGGSGLLGQMGDAQAWLDLLGRLHVVSVHFPIALVIVGALIEVLRLPRRRVEPPARWRPSGGALACIVIGALMGGVVAWSGWVYADEIGASGAEVDVHRWLGIVAAGAAGLAALVGVFAWIAPDRARLAGYRFLALVGAVAVAFAGHFGGGLVHGSGHVTGPLRVALGLAPAPESQQIAAAEPEARAQPPEASGPVEPDSAPVEAGAIDAPPAPAGAAPSSALAAPATAASVTFAQVQPIFESACYRCHGSQRQRGRLRLDSEEGALSVVARGDAGASELFHRITLPPEDDDRMPKGADPLSPEQIALIGAWIDALEAEAPAPEPDPQPASDPETPEPAPPAPMPELTEAERATRDQALADLRARGLVAQVVAEGVDACEVRIVGAATFADEDVALLGGLESSLIWLDLTGSQVTGDVCAKLADFGRLRRLRLGETGIDDTGAAALGSLAELEMLDLHGSQVTDAGLEPLGALPRLRSLYLWGTQVTPEGAAALLERLPWLKIDLGQQ